MQKLIQTRLVTTHKSGNCLQTVVACLLNLPIDEVPDFSTMFWKEIEQENIKKAAKERYENSNLVNREHEYYSESCNLWLSVFDVFIASQGYRVKRMYQGENVLPEYSLDLWLKDNPDKFYAASGDSLRGVSHIVIYQNGNLYHDPHPSQTGLVEGTIYEYKYFEKL